MSVLRPKCVDYIGYLKFVVSTCTLRLDKFSGPRT